MAEKTLQFLDLVGLSQYDEKIKAYVDGADAKSLKGVALDGNKLLFYTDLPIEGATAKHEIELPKTDLSDVIKKFESATAGNVIVVAEDGKTIVDSGKAFSDLASKEDVEASQAKADAIEALVGSIPETSKSSTIVAYIQELTAGIATDAALEELTSNVNENKLNIAELQGQVGVLNADENTAGSVKKTIADEIAKIIADAPESFDTLKEISDWISSHAESASAMNTAITENNTAIDALKAYVGTLPEDATATNVVDYIAEALEEADLAKYATAADLASAVERIAKNESAITLINTSLAEGGVTYKAIQEAKKTGEDAQTSVDTLKSYVGTFVADEDITTVVGYIDAKVTKASSDIENRLKAVEDAVATKAEKKDLDELSTKVTTAEGNITANTTSIEALQETVNSIAAIPQESINAMFE